MRVEVTETKLYRYEELSEEAKEQAYSSWLENAGDSYWYESTLDDAVEVAAILGIDVMTETVKLMNGQTRKGHSFAFSGFWSQGDGASYSGYYRYAKGSQKAIRAYAPQDTELHEIADTLARIQKPYLYSLEATITRRGNYCHSGTMSAEVDSPLAFNKLPWEELEQTLREFADWVYGRLENEYDYQTSREAFEDCDAPNSEYKEDGTWAGWL